MQQPDSELGKYAIALHSPDHDPRESALFAELQTEIDKLASLHATGTPDWPRVSQLAERYLREEAKDLTVGVWLGVAWLHTAGGAGLCAAAHVLIDLVRGCWDELLPARPRARRSQMAWFEEQAERFMKSDRSLPLLKEDAYAAMLQDWRDLDSVWRERDEMAASLAGLALRFAQWPVQEAPAVAQEPATESSIASEAAAPDAFVLPTAPAAPVVPAASATPAPPASGHIALEAGAQWDGPDALERALEQAMDSLAGALEAGVRQFPGVPLLYRLNRARVWAALESAPPAQQNETRIPGPHERQRERLAQLMASADNAELLAFAESQLSTSRFWLDLNLASFNALSALPSGKAAAAAVAQETAALLARIPTLQTLCFADGSPFADAPTREWLSSSAARTGPATAQPASVSAAAPSFSAPAAGLLSLSVAISAATAQTESAQVLLASALSRLHDSAQQVARHAFPEHQSS